MNAAKTQIAPGKEMFLRIFSGAAQIEVSHTRAFVDKFLGKYRPCLIEHGQSVKIKLANAPDNMSQNTISACCRDVVPSDLNGMSHAVALRAVESIISTSIWCLLLSTHFSKTAEASATQSTRNDFTRLRNINQSAAYIRDYF